VTRLGRSAAPLLWFGRFGLLGQQLPQPAWCKGGEVLDDGERGLEVGGLEGGGHGHAAHTGTVSGLLAQYGIFEHDAVLRLHAQPGGGGSVGIGVGLAPGARRLCQ
jgi:hypothetical protein